MKFNFKIIAVLAVALFLVSGCTGGGGTAGGAGGSGSTGGAAGGSTGAGNFFGGLQATPDTYCITYTTSGDFSQYAGAGETPYGGEEFEISAETCYTPDKVVIIGAFQGINTTTLYDRTANKTTTCLDTGQGGSFCTDEDGVSGLPDQPFAASVRPSDFAAYNATGTRNIAGVQAQCFTFDAGAFANRADYPNVPAEDFIVTMCSHPTFDYLLYYEGLGLTTEVSNFTTTVPASKFALPENAQDFTDFGAGDLQ